VAKGGFSLGGEEFKLLGLDKLDRKLARLPASLRRKAATKAVRAGAKPILKAAKAAAAKETGLLQRALGVRVRSDGKSVYIVIGPRAGQIRRTGKAGFRADKLRAKLSGSQARRRPTMYAHLVEGGAAPHVQPGRKGRTIFLSGRFVRLKSDMHPGARAKPFMAPAFARNQRRALAAMIRELRKWVREQGPNN
jgi:HK97 gp10 family phage protein